MEILSCMLLWLMFGEIEFAHIIADYDAELRKADGRVDVELLIDRLRNLGVNTYFYLIWHAGTDWDDLKLFLPKARDAGIEVWVYLVPPSEPPAPEPFRYDYVRWAREIALLSRRYPNLKAWVIDDFYGNRLFTPDYIAKVQRSAKGINPDLAFLPLMYYDQINLKFAERYSGCIDGVVAAYPHGRDEIARARQILSDSYVEAGHSLFSFPAFTPSRPGDCAEISQTAKVLPGIGRYVLRFEEYDNYTGPTAGYHFKQLLIGDQVVWESDVAGGGKGWHKVECDVSRFVRGKREVRLSFRGIDKKGVSQFGVEMGFRELGAEGLELGTSNFGVQEGWHVYVRGRWRVSFHPERGGLRRFNIPLVVMTAGSMWEYLIRHRMTRAEAREAVREMTDADRKRLAGEIADQFEMALDAMDDGLCDGVVIYCLDKKPGSPAYAAIREVLKRRRGKKER